MLGRSAPRSWRGWPRDCRRRNVRRLRGLAESQGFSQAGISQAGLVRQGGAVMEQAMLEYLANALWQLPVLAAGAWSLLWLTKPGPQTQYRVWLAVLGFAVLLPAWGIRSGTIAAVPGASFDELATARIVQRSAGVVAV